MTEFITFPGYLFAGFVGACLVVLVSLAVQGMQEDSF